MATSMEPLDGAVFTSIHQHIANFAGISHEQAEELLPAELLRIIRETDFEAFIKIFELSQSSRRSAN